MVKKRVSARPLSTLPPVGNLPTKVAPAPAKRLPPMSVRNDCLLPLAEGLERITSHCWRAAYPQLHADADMSKELWYLNAKEFRRDPSLALHALYKDFRLDDALTYFQVHESVALAKEIERRLREPQTALGRVVFRANQILGGDWYGEEDTAVGRQFPIDTAGYLREYYENNPHHLKAIDDLLDEWDGLRNDLAATARYLRQIVAAFDARPTRRPVVPAADSLATIWYHGQKSYSLNGLVPIVVSQEQHSILQRFLDSKIALDSRELSEECSNVSRVMDALAERFRGTVRRPAAKGEGYYIPVRALTPTK